MQHKFDTLRHIATQFLSCMHGQMCDEQLPCPTPGEVGRLSGTELNGGGDSNSRVHPVHPLIQIGNKRVASRRHIGVDCDGPPTAQQNGRILWNDNEKCQLE